MRTTDIDPDSLNRPDGNDLLSNYELHDCGEAYFTELMESTGLQAEPWGLDMRHDDSGLIFDNKMDLRLWEPLNGQSDTPQWPTEKLVHGITEQWDMASETVKREWQLRGVVDVKTKSNPDWMGKFNVRHLVHYAEWADHYDVPVFVYMTVVDSDAGVVGDDEFVVPITTDWDFQILANNYDTDSSTNLTYGDIKDICRKCDISERVFRAPDGNLVFDIADEHKQSIADLLERL